MSVANRSSSVSRRTEHLAFRPGRRPPAGARVVVVGGHRAAVRPGSRAPRPGRRAGGRRAGTRRGRRCHRPGSPCPTTRVSTVRARGAVGDRARVVGVVQRGPDVVAHPAVDRHVGADRPAVQRDRLDRPTVVERCRSTGRRWPGRVRSTAWAARSPRALHSCSTILVISVASCAGSLGSSWVVYAMPNPPPRSSSGLVDAGLVANPGVQCEHAASRDLEARGVEDLACRCGCAGRAARAPAAASTRRTASRASPRVIEKPELLVLVRGGDVFVGVRLDPGGHAHHDRLECAEARGDLREPLDLDERVEDDPADAFGDRPPPARRWVLLLPW